MGEKTTIKFGWKLSEMMRNFPLPKTLGSERMKMATGYAFSTYIYATSVESQELPPEGADHSP